MTWTELVLFLLFVTIMFCNIAFEAWRSQEWERAQKPLRDARDAELEEERKKLLERQERDRESPIVHWKDLTDRQRAEKMRAMWYNT